MATMNLFELLGGDDAEDPTQLVAASLKVEKTKKPPAGAQPATAQQPKSGSGKMPTKPLPPAQAVREARNEAGRGGGGGRGYGGGRGRGGGGFNRDSGNNENTYGSNNGFSGGYRPSEEGEGKTSERRVGYGAPRGGFRGGRRGGFSNDEGGDGERPRRAYERRSGTGRGSEVKREGSGRGNWGTPTDEIAPETEEPINEIEKNVVSEKQQGEEDATDINKDAPVNDQTEEKEPEEDKEMTLEEYEKVLEEKRKALLALKVEERKVSKDKDFESMQQLSNKKTGDEIFVKLGSEKEKRKEAGDKEEKPKKSVSITEFLKPAEGERYFGGRSRGRGRGARGGYSHGGNVASGAKAPSIEDPKSFPSLGGK